MAVISIDFVVKVDSDKSKYSQAAQNDTKTHKTANQGPHALQDTETASGSSTIAAAKQDNSPKISNLKFQKLPLDSGCTASTSNTT